MKKIPLALLTLFFAGALRAQELGINDLIAVRKMDFQTIDSLLQTKKYLRQHHGGDDTTIRVYRWTGVSNTGQPLMRSVHIGRPPGRAILDVEYGVWQKSDAQQFIDLLVKAGFVERKVTMPDIGGGTSSTLVEYRKNKIDVSYKEEPQGGVTLYLFSVDEF